ncbi:hypothetical protein [Paucisalibacillus sp. EB02]|uniref:hypothetical protein n=1 Tax=Paucisalibacillus sp. EB02 TaxID=1347087 RepID=UPI0004AF9C19|nr:hypothetical protein [Paucisalibacillus sp. EB02]
MTKKVFKISVSILTAFTIFLGAQSVFANEINSGAEIQQDRKYVTYGYKSKAYPPQYYYYNDGVYSGYLSRAGGEYVNGYWLVNFAGYVYRNGTPIPSVVEEIE